MTVSKTTLEWLSCLTPGSLRAVAWHNHTSYQAFLMPRKNSLKTTCGSLADDPVPRRWGSQLQWSLYFSLAEGQVS